MDKYIKQSEVLAAINAIPSSNWSTKRYSDVVKAIPAVDVVEVRHGMWRDTGSGQECSACKKIQYGYDTGRFFCANCGAKMDGEENK